MFTTTGTIASPTGKGFRPLPARAPPLLFSSVMMISLIPFSNLVEFFHLLKEGPPPLRPNEPYDASIRRRDDGQMG